MREEKELQDVVWDALEAVCPERVDELRAYRSSYAPVFHILEDTIPEGNIVFEGGLYKFVRFNHRTMRLFWLSSYLLWEGYEALARYGRTGETDVLRFREIQACFEATRTASDVDDVKWPDDIPKPGDLVEHIEGRADRVAGELAIFSVCWAFLHELQHLIHQQEGTSAAAEDLDACRLEELSCDRFATGLLLERLPEYAKAAGQPLDALTMKRQTAVHGSLFAIALIARAEWGQSDSHPALQTRIESAVAEMERLGLNLMAAAIGAAAFAALQLEHKDAPSPLAVPSVAKAFEESVARGDVAMPAS